MPTPAITASTRYFPRGTSKCYYVPSIAASTLTPTRAELNAGTDLSPQLADWSGFSVTGEQIDTPDLATTFNSKIPGATSAEESSLTMYSSKDGVDSRTLLARSVTGYIVWMPGGDVSGYKASVWPVTVTSNSEVIASDDAGKRNIQFAVTALPQENVTIPA